MHNSKFWYSESVEQVMRLLNSSPMGLDKQEATDRLEEYGRNKLPEAQGDTVLKLFLRQFTSPLVYILLIVSVVVIFLNEIGDAVIILFILVFNAIIGALQEGKAQKTLSALKHFVATQALVKRAGQEDLIDDELLVPGDIVILKEGMRVPADARLLSGAGIKVDEASLTGESEPVLKSFATLVNKKHGLPAAEQANMVFKGTHVVAGSAEAVVVATGLKTEIGRISTEIISEQSEIPLQVNMKRMSRLIIIAVVLISTSLFFIGLASGKGVVEMFTTVVSLAVSIIPEGLPIALTLVLANGVWRMGKRQALVKKLAAVEALGQATIIAVDKTGTITANEMVVRNLIVEKETYQVTGQGYDPNGHVMQGENIVSAADIPNLELAARTAVLCSTAEILFDEQKQAWTVSGDPTEAAVKVFAEKLGFNQEDMLRRHAQVQEISFDYRLKFRGSVNKNGSGYLLSVIGAPEAIFRLSGKHESFMNETINDLSSRGIRVIAYAYAQVNGPVDASNLPKVDFGGLYGLKDTLHPEVSESVQQVRTAGIKTVMITGDHKITAQAIAAEAAIWQPGDKVITGAEIDSMTKPELAKALDKVSVFARVTPEHKLRIVQAYQHRGDVVAMTGDGVNDAPALVAADLGLAMGKVGTEVAKEAADIVLLDDNFSSIVAAVEEGRNIYQTIRRVIFYLFSTSMGELFTIAVAIIIGYPLPVLAVQILWLNFVTDGFLVIALAAEPKHQTLLQHPFKSSKYLVNWGMVSRMIPMTIVMVAGTLLLFREYYHFDYQKATTIAMTTLAIFQWFNAWNSRSGTKSIFTMGLLRNKYLVMATLGVILFQILALHWPILQKMLHAVPLSPGEWGVAILMSTSIIIIEELRKFIVRRTAKFE